MEGENASGYRGEKERETEAEGDSAVEAVVISCLFGESVHFFINFLLVPGTETKH